MANKNNSNKNKKTSQGPSKSGSTSKKKTADTSKVSQASQKSTTSKPSKNSKGKVVSKKKKIIKRVFLALLFLFLALFVIGLGYVFAIISSAPPLDVDAVKNLSQASVLYDRDGEFMDNVHSDIDRQIVDGNKIPQNLKNAFVSIEDERFYKHPGIDVRRILGSAVTDVVKIFKGKRGLHGGSTITQQLLKNTILSNEDFIIERKIKEIYLALQLEKHLDKDEILVQYLNTIPLGGVTYGVEAASNLYFGKSVDKLNLIQCAYIAGVTQAPHTYSAYNPNNKDNPSIYLNRTKTVLGKMKELGYISEEEYNQAISDIDNGGLVFTPKSISYRLDYEWYINPTVTEVKRDLKEKYKYSDEEVNKLLANGGLRIYTNMDRDLQDYAQKVLDETTAATVRKQETYVAGTKTPEFQGAATVVDYKTGEVLALIGGRGEQGANSLNRAYSDLKSIGSSTKPLTVYGPAIEEKLITAGDTTDDAPIPSIDVNNVDFSHVGNITIRDALANSKNIGTVKTQMKIGDSLSKRYGEKFGITYSNASKGYSAFALGEFHNAANDRDGATPYILASAFGVFGNGGVYTEPKLYSKVTDASGNILLEKETETKRIFSEQTAYIMYDLLKDAQTKSASNTAKFGAMPVAGKTGTTTGRKDLWFSGLTPHLSASVWLGYDNRTSMDNGYSSASARVWGKIMAKASEGMSTKDISMPNNIVKVAVCKDSGHLPTDLCRQDPRGNRVYEEYFIKGTEPTGYCENHVKVKVNSANNKLATPNTPSHLVVEKIFVKKASPNPVTDDYKYVLPTEYDDTVGAPALPPSDTGNEDEDLDGDDELPEDGTGSEDTNNNPEKPEKPEKP
ncbi:MAG: transglycosylase domain-containing protein [Clostridium sp.]|uniref:transglycosylase domain-containing protein n=1 Tax=Clostridium sp. TaxID=1506 RepID=UPI0029154906|nr:transglycosylase domain-containing protein [Clostridium sp.]MDU4937445.1 transglycosylase domain-containing protein [Clostridium sp.]